MSCFLSIIIPEYNASNTVQRCLDSIILASLRVDEKIEIVIIDDCSSDDSYNMIMTYADEHKNDSVIFKIYKNAINCGPSYCRNIGLTKCSGDYISFVDADDYVSETYVECLYDFMKYGADICVFGFTSTILKNKLFPDSFEEQIVFLFENNLFGFTCNKLVRRDFLRSHNIKFNENLFLCEDLDFYINLFSKTKKIVFFNKKIYEYDIQNSQLTKKKYSNNVYDRIYMMTKSFFSEKSLLRLKKGIKYFASYNANMLFLINFDRDTNIYKDSCSLNKHLSLPMKLKKIILYARSGVRKW